MWLPITLGLMALGSFGVAVRGLSSNRPFVYSPRWFLSAVATVFWVNFAQVVVNAVNTPTPTGHVAVAPMIVPGVLAFVTLFMLFQFRGFHAVGITGPLFREALFVS